MIEKTDSHFDLYWWGANTPKANINDSLPSWAPLEVNHSLQQEKQSI